ncbi:hypothetical protein MARINON1_52738 [Marinobacter salarius]|uniref:hypothetical protein n=1 Tax=Marinobacter salarius TaxID=1420917 RepID=UPI0012569495|nr:hypothetical protein [Marinobacter salarius]VVT01111.1 hypothetical protein MBHK15_110004 [Marinobacter salarius]VXC33966.1 hypothetical protein MARINON1_52738 [Marinobacter salarius]
MMRSEAVISSLPLGSPISLKSAVELLGRSISFSYSIPGLLYETGDALVVAVQIPAYGSGQQEVLLLRKEAGDQEYYDLHDIEIYRVGPGTEADFKK